MAHEGVFCESLTKCAFRGMIEALFYLGETRSASITGGQINFEPGPGGSSDDARQSTKNASHVGAPGDVCQEAQHRDL